MIIVIAAAVTVFSSCEEEDGGGTFELTSDPKWITADFKAGDYEVNITTNGEWEAFAYNSWCTVKPTNGSGSGTITVSLEGSPSDTPRNTTVEVVAKLDGKSERILIDVLQSASIPQLTVNSSEKNIGFESQTVELVVSTNLPKWNLLLPPWCEAEPGSPLSYKDQDGLLRDYVIKFKAKENSSKNVREGVVRIFGLEKPVDVKIKQGPTEYFYLERTGGTKEFEFTGSWTAVSSEQWLTVPGSGNGAVTLTCSENTDKFPRKSILTITSSDNVKRVVAVVQKPHLSPNLNQSWTDAQGNTHASIPADKEFWNTGEVLEYNKATKGKGVNIVYFNDAFNKMEMAVGGVYETSATEMAELFLSMPVVRDYKEYFNIYILMTVWDRSGLYNQYPDGAFHAPYDGRESTFLDQIRAMPQLKNISPNETTGVYFANGMAGGYMITFSNGMPWTSFSFNTKDNCPYWTIHEFMGHAFSSLGDVYLANSDISTWDIFLKSVLPVNSPNEDKLGNDWAPNCRLAEWDQEAWNKFIAIPGNEKYADNLDSEYRRPLPEGYREKHPDYAGSDYIWRVDYAADFMNAHVMSSSGWSRFLVYRRIMMWAGEDYSLLDFFANDQQYANCTDWYELLGLHGWQPSYDYDPHQESGSPFAPWDE